MRRQRLAQRISILLVLVLTAVSLSACGAGKVSNPSYQYDASRYNLCSALDGVQFLVPRELDDGKEEEDNFSVYDANNLPKHSFESLEVNSYQLFKPGTYGCYAFYVGNIDHVEGERDVTRLPNMMGISGTLSFTARDGESFHTYADEKTGYIRNVFPVVIHDIPHNLDWYGYLTLLKNPSNGRNYAFADGFAEEGREKLARYFANSFVMVNQN